MGADSEITRRGILEAARDVIGERGYQAATFQQIALRAGVSRPTLHYYFDSRDHIYDVLLTEIHQRLAECVEQAQREVGLRNQLSRFAETLQRWSVEESRTVQFLIAARLEHHRGLHRAEAAARVFAAVHAFYDSVVIQAAQRGELRPGLDVGAVADMLAAVFWGAGFHAGFLRSGNAEADRVDVARLLLGVFDNGLLEIRLPASVEA